MEYIAHRPGARPMCAMAQTAGAPGSQASTKHRPPTSKAIVQHDKRATPANSLLAALPRKDRSHLVAGCEDAALVLSDVLFAPGERIRHVHFPVNGYVSLLSPVDEATRLEVGLVGDEGMVGTPLVLGVPDRRCRRSSRVPAGRSGWKPPPSAAALGQSEALRLLLNRYVFARMTQLAQAAGCTRFHLVEARLARWLLMTQDRAHSDSFHITHEFLALILGVRRAGVTKAATSLQKAGLIRYSRGNISVLDRAGLKASSCACYRSDRETYRRVLG